VPADRLGEQPPANSPDRSAGGATKLNTRLRGPAHSPRETWRRSVPESREAIAPPTPWTNRAAIQKLLIARHTAQRGSRGENDQPRNKDAFAAKAGREAPARSNKPPNGIRYALTTRPASIVRSLDRAGWLVGHVDDRWSRNDHQHSGTQHDECKPARPTFIKARIVHRASARCEERRVGARRGNAPQRGFNGGHFIVRDIGAKMASDAVLGGLARALQRLLAAGVSTMCRLTAIPRRRGLAARVQPPRSDRPVWSGRFTE